MNDSQKQLSALSLIAVIIGSTIGSGIFTITADMAAAGAHTGAILIGWLICGVGMLGLMMCYFGLNKVRPDLTNGVYSYAGEGFGDVESVKAVSDLISPVSGVVCAVNEELEDSPEALNADPYGAWIIKVERVTDEEELLDAADYAAFCAGEG